MTQPVQPLRMVQLSDFHLFADRDGRLLGLNTQFSLEKVLERVRQERPVPDFVVATGDLSQDGSYPSYQRLEETLAVLEAPIYWLEGNHDKPAPMLRALSGQAGRISPCVAEEGPWTLVLLDSTIPGEVPGELFDDDLSFLDQALASARGEHVLVCLHHHPVPMGSRWLDTQLVASAERFFAVIDAHPRVRGILWGHVHQEYDAERNGVRLLAVPSTCVQFKPGSDDFAVDDASPGYRWLDLWPDGRIDTAVSRVEGIEFNVDLTVKGY
ncbi:3',5'-cyclic-AMP phosphodiesterase [Alcanivorax marinus]|uniref:3',5'-cyclic-AMP phosphodiesterase n=1 Tax=Alloalcanivorax marinus TaxID=1177169 RepID=A0A9Q3UPW5_9GAMM|nr:3',5'-cyclic-AMP phosphodiesterase [Alloalcanivorax marinus]MCC4309926.1 3',5'-cyclic-AMP phosphodiesterase [Alloalcanivorax marinus]MCH2558663.1 3',5'-cyclic-AMP phosphodiesterase [Alcanivorax sp.]MCU5786257.1 icc protein [Alloalcanivorax marinus]